MPNRSSEFQEFVSLAANFISEKCADSSPAGKMSARLFSNLEFSRPSPAQTQPDRLPVCAHLDAALAFAREQNDAVRGLANAFAAIEPQLTWKQRPGAAAHGPEFLHGHANALLIGPQGAATHATAQIGVSLMAPQTRYPDHNHSPEEIYIVMSEGEWFQAGKPWITPGVGNLVHNPPNITHAMRSGDRPLFAFWFLAPPEPDA